jgi:hypothetical protein
MQDYVKKICKDIDLLHFAHDKSFISFVRVRKNKVLMCVQYGSWAKDKRAKTCEFDKLLFSLFIYTLRFDELGDCLLHK